MSQLERLLAIMARLRDPEHGCPWDREQTLASLVPHTLEEAYEVAEAAERGEPEALRQELGDLLFQVVFYAQIAREVGWFDFEAVAGAIGDKMIRRHPHVFGDERVADAREQSERWEAIKAQERGGEAAGGALDGVSPALPALSRARKLQQRAARQGFDWPDHHGVLAKLEEELDEVREAWAGGQREAIEDELGDLLFVCVNLIRHAGLDPEAVLRRANRKFERRFRAMEALAETAHGRPLAELDLAQQEALWQRSKRREADDE